ncbi:uncharacterized protein LOC131689859 isoform X1 [Topomyia yanbarensis]|uniref:uncharacterized protein LOC131689859 isoform X1 n=1 Tax=Topomyia yanbarensis TaxID=2498891 RepID=UPI00273CD59D|nr:uncharacterized protein LOC131689859 isoform X1 [Topomyia yanbarensis]
MFRHHTARFGSCASEVHRTLCYFFAGVNIFIVIDLLADFTSNGFLDKFHDDDSADARSPNLLIPLGPGLANVCLAVLLIVGVYTRRPGLIRIFKVFIVAQMVVLIFAIVFAFQFLWVRDDSYLPVIAIFAIAAVLFGIEGWIAGDYHKILLEEIQRENSAASLQA